MNSTPWENGFLKLQSEWTSPDRSSVIVLPIPYERTTSYGKGTIHAPEAIIEASRYLELYDEELGVEPFRLTGGIATERPIHFDGGDRDAESVSIIRDQVSGLVEKGKLTICLGGEHTIAIGPAQVYSERYPGLSILQLDAHSDLRQEYEGSRYSHACTMARIYEFNPRIVQVGIRSQSAEEAAFIRRNGTSIFYAVEIKEGRYGPGNAWHDEVIGLLSENVYLTFDCDFFDPSLVPALGTPEPGGFDWDETIPFLRALANRRNIVGFDVNELSPALPFVSPQFTIAKLIYKLIGYIFGRNHLKKSSISRE